MPLCAVVRGVGWPPVHAVRMKLYYVALLTGFLVDNGGRSCRCGGSTACSALDVAHTRRCACARARPRPAWQPAPMPPVRMGRGRRREQV